MGLLERISETDDGAGPFLSLKAKFRNPFGTPDGGSGQFFEHTCAYARWAFMHRFLSVRLWSLDQNPKLENNSYLAKYSSSHFYFSTAGIFIASDDPPSRESTDHGLMAGVLTSTSSCIFFSITSSTLDSLKAKFRKPFGTPDGGSGQFF